MIAAEDILFIMPKDGELQFPAMSALQNYVNDYKTKMQANTVTPTVPQYRLRYWAEMSAADWEFFQGLGIELTQDREEIAFPDAVIDLSDARLLTFYNSEKHAGQACAAIAGVECPPYPKVRQVEPRLWSGRINCVDPGTFEALSRGQLAATCLQLWCDRDFTDPSYFDYGDVFVGFQSRLTYALAAMNVPVIEILPRHRSVNWMSKWKNPLYRLVEEDKLDRLPGTLRNIEAILKYVVEQQAQCPSSPVPADAAAAT